MLTLDRIMTREVFTLSPTASADQAAWAFTIHGISGAPVLDSAGRLVGVLSKTDLTDPERNDPGNRGRLVRDLMTPAIFALRETDDAMKAIKLMVREGIHRIVVLDGDGSLAGIVTPTDILKAVVQGHSLEEMPGMGAFNAFGSSGGATPLQ